MPHSTIAPLSVVEYTRDYIIEFVRYITNWSQREEVANKPQLIYLCKYLEVDHVNCQTIVVETDYVDRHFLDDYSEYYARCFPNHPRRCSRLHFFSKAIPEVQFKNYLDERDEKFQGLLQSSYIGYIVVRPIPQTFFAKICLRTYTALAGDEYRILRKRMSVSLFGIPLHVDTIPFVEQDKVVSACATSAVWTALSAAREMPINSLPSPSAITKSASDPLYDGTRTFPTAGLTASQVARAIKHYGLEPSKFWDGAKTLADLKSHLFSYISNGSPVLLGGNVYEREASGEYRKLGPHFVCVVGYSLAKKAGSPGMALSSDWINKIYVHDDRYGPFVRLNLEPIQFKSKDETPSGFALSLHGVREEYFVPDLGIVGLYHKIRIMYQSIFDACKALHQYLENTATDNSENIANGTYDDDAKAKSLYQSLDKHLRKFLGSSWEIALTTNTAIKEEIHASETFLTFNGSVDRSSILLPNMPKYIWRCRLLQHDSAEIFSDILFDATEVPQGRVLIGYVSYDVGAQGVWQMVEKCVVDRSWQKYKASQFARESISCFLKFFDESRDRTYLNNHYGPLGLPRRSLKPGETDSIENITQRKDVYVVRRGSSTSSWNFLSQGLKYIWVIDESGDIVVGEDVAINAEFKGHPTLIDGKPARLGGELVYRESASGWIANLNSRTYSGHLDKKSQIAATYLNHVIANNLQGLQVKAELAASLP